MLFQIRTISWTSPAASKSQIVHINIFHFVNHFHCNYHPDLICFFCLFLLWLNQQLFYYFSYVTKSPIRLYLMLSKVFLFFFYFFHYFFLKNFGKFEHFLETIQPDESLHRLFPMLMINNCITIALQLHLSQVWTKINKYPNFIDIHPLISCCYFLIVIIINIFNVIHLFLLLFPSFLIIYSDNS